MADEPDVVESAPSDDPGDRVVELDERRLLPRHCSGDEAAFSELVAAYRAPVYGYLVRNGLAAEVRDDLFQDVFLKVHRAASSYQPSRPLKPWIFTILANTVRSHFRKQQTEGGVIASSQPPADGGAGSVPRADDAVAAKDTVAWLEGALLELPLGQRETLILTCVEGMDQKQVSQALQIPVNTVKTHLRRARLRLARALADRDATS